jgi:hypothetical protein
MASLALWLLPLLFLGVFASSLLRIGIRRYRRKLETPPNTHCRCGYELNNLSRIRCPECGRVFGFNATPEELGLSDDELRLATEARERRQAEKLAQQRSPKPL